MPWEQASALADPFWPWAVVGCGFATCFFFARPFEIVVDHYLLSPV